MLVLLLNTRIIIIQRLRFSSDADIVRLTNARIITVVFFYPSASTKFQEEPLQRGRKIQGVGKFRDFRLKSPSISETCIF